MNKSDLLRLMNHRLREVEMLIDALQAEEVMHDIDIDLLLSKIRELYGDAKGISSIQQEPLHEPEITKELFEEPEMADQIDVDEDQHADESDEGPIEESFEEVVDEVIEEPIEGPFEEPEEESVEEVPEEPDDEADDEDVEQAKLLEEPKEKLLTGIKMQSVEDIMVAIGLNDRFLFTRVLFNNDSELFSSTIKALNARDSWEEAVAYLDSRFDWDPRDPTLVLFLSFVKRRFL